MTTIQGSSPLNFILFLVKRSSPFSNHFQKCIYWNSINSMQTTPGKKLSWCNNSIHVNSTLINSKVEMMCPTRIFRHPKTILQSCSLISYPHKMVHQYGPHTPSNSSAGIVKLLRSCCQVRINYKGLLLDITHPYFQEQLFHLLDEWHCSLSNSLIPTCL